MKNNEIEIPFGAKDSELIESTYHIPYGMEAIIEGDKVIIRKKASNDEKIRKKLIHLVKKSNEYGGYALHKDEADEMIAWLEKQRYSEFELENEYWRGYDDAKFHLKEDKVTVIGAGSNSAWSEEDERIYHSLLADIRASQDGSTNTLEAYYNEQIDWLESLKERLKGE